MVEHRPIEKGAFADIAAPPDIGPAPQLQWLPIASLVVDDSYQRSLDGQGSRKNVRLIAGSFDWRRFAPVIVSPVAGGKYAIVDGQHRCTAALLVGVEQVPCQVIMADRREQARAFEAINGHVTRITGQALYKARLQSGEPVAVRVNAVAQAAGVRVLTYNPSATMRRPGETTAIRAIEKLLEQHGEETVRVTLRTIRVNADELNGYLTGPIITAVGTVLGDHLEWRDHPGLDGCLSDFDLEAAWRQACIAAAQHRGTTSQDQLQALLITHLEKALRAVRAA